MALNRSDMNTMFGVLVAARRSGLTRDQVDWLKQDRARADYFDDAMGREAPSAAPVVDWGAVQAQIVDYFRAQAM